VPAWYDPGMNTGKIAWDGRPITTGRTWEGAVQDRVLAGLPVPPAVRTRYDAALAELPELRTRSEKLQARR